MEIEALPPGDALVSAACSHFLARRPIYRCRDLPRKGCKSPAEGKDVKGCWFQAVCKDEIVRIESAGEETVIHLSDKSLISSSAKLKVFAAALKDQMFCLVNPENLINLFYMERLDRPAATVVLTNSEQIPVSEEGVTELTRLFDRTDLI